MLGRKELANLDLQKQALLLESGLNRVALQAEVQSLRSSTAWVSNVTSASRGLAPLMVVLAPLAGFLLARRSRRSNSWLSRLMALAKWAVPLYRLWKSFSARRSEPEAGTPAA
jgi:hypothetical protein